jgi:hypothetical protein
MTRKTARSSALTIVVLAAIAGAVNVAPAPGQMTFQKYPDTFGGHVAPHAIVPLWREPVSKSRYSVAQVECASPAAAAQGTSCFVAGP